MTETRFYEPARLSTPPKPLFSLKPLDANLLPNTPKPQNAVDEYAEVGNANTVVRYGKSLE